MPLFNRILHHVRRGQLICPLCNEPVRLEDSKADEDGHATHEECYVKKLCGSERAVETKKTVNSK